MEDAAYKSAQHGDWNEYYNGCCGRGKNRSGNFVPALVDTLSNRVFHFAGFLVAAFVVAVNLIQHNRGTVHNHTKRNYKTGESHEVEGDVKNA